MAEASLHTSVLLDAAVEALRVKADGFFVDATFGRGGHSAAILRQLGGQGRLLALDCDWDALHSQEAAALSADPRFCLRHARFSQLRQLLAAEGWLGQVDGLLLDIGVSSPQLDDAQRGFSFQNDGPLDMRMDRNDGITAAEWLQQVSEQELVRVLFEYGEERFAKRIAAAIVKRRVEAPLQTTRQLAELVAQAVPIRDKHKHPATRSFQAIRIALNAELDELQRALPQTLEALRPGGRLVVIAFHSLEDRIVKRFIRDASGGVYAPGKLPLPGDYREKPSLKKIGKAVRADAEEVAANPRARSAVLRIAERL